MKKKRFQRTKATLKKRATRRPDTAWHDRFLNLLSESCNVTLAARGAGVGRTRVYEHRKLFPDFAARWAEAEILALAELEAAAWKRAMARSDRLIMLLFKAHRPEKYRDFFPKTIKQLPDEELTARTMHILEEMARTETAGT